jgi:hypothetical protein
MAAIHPIAEVRLGSRSRFGLQLRKFTSCGCRRQFPSSTSIDKPFAQRAVVEANPIAAFDSSLTHHKASMGQTYMLAQKRLESAFLCIIQTFVEWLGGICEFFELDRDCFQLDRIRLELFSPFS